MFVKSETKILEEGVVKRCSAKLGLLLLRLTSHNFLVKVITAVAEIQKTSK
jgi:hypothetical protein